MGNLFRCTGGNSVKAKEYFKYVFAGGNGYMDIRKYSVDSDGETLVQSYRQLGYNESYRDSYIGIGINVVNNDTGYFAIDAVKPYYLNSPKNELKPYGRIANSYYAGGQPVNITVYFDK